VTRPRPRFRLVGGAARWQPISGVLSVTECFANVTLIAGSPMDAFCARKRHATLAELLARRDARIAERNDARRERRQRSSADARLSANLTAAVDLVNVLRAQDAPVDEVRAAEALAMEALSNARAVRPRYMRLPVRPPGLTDSESAEWAPAAREYAAEQFRSLRADLRVPATRRSNCPTARARRSLRARRPRGRRSRRVAGTRAGPSSDTGESEPAPRPAAHDVGVAHDWRAT
jgi:hypothetical protein